MKIDVKYIETPTYVLGDDYEFVCTHDVSTTQGWDTESGFEHGIGETTFDYQYHTCDHCDAELELDYDEDTDDWHGYEDGDDE